VNPIAKWLLLGSSGATFLTGVAYGWMKYLMEPVSAWAVVNHPLQPFMLKAHILVAPVLVFALGVIAVDHIWKHYRSRVRPGRRSGLTMMWLVVPMIVSGYLIQAVTQEGWLTAMIWAHLITGGVYGVAMFAHWVAFARRRRIRERLGGGRREDVGTMPGSAPATASDQGVDQGTEVATLSS